ncbi:N-acyl-D-amino-acid deacylase family protein [Nocardia sp. A7]|uniref:N-acyl-D-amino-acid deacylase family protein n=1 Tax=Nocardia sp. A7 TaxID=2789274 RepID=UPI00397B42D7
MSHYSLVIRNGTVFDGTGSSPVQADVGVREGAVITIGRIEPGSGEREIDATGKWVIPGMIDVHTHYDAEVLGSPGLGESVRHGVTSVVLGNCSLSTVYADAEDCADLFARVEALPWDAVHSAVKEHKSWSGPQSYVDAINARPLGANVAAFLGHSDIRAAVMGLGRATDAEQKPSTAELARMTGMLTEALDAGFLGLSTIRSSFSKLEGSRWPARLLPSTYASWREYATLNEVLRTRGRIHQSTPNLAKRSEMARYFVQSMGRKRKPLKTTVISAADVKADRSVVRIAIAAARIVNKLGGDGFRWQHLPVPFEVYADGIDVVVFEEFGSGAAALNIRDVIARGDLLADESFRRRFRKDMTKKFGFKVWHRDLHDAEIVSCPDTTVVGRSFGAIADERGIEPVDALLDLAVAHGTDLRWRTTIANDRDDVLDELQQSEVVQVGFADSGAHLRNMAFYNFGVRMLERVHARKFMPVETAVHRLTGELADWYGIDAGHLTLGSRADLAVIDPTGFDGSSGAYAEAPMPGLDGIDRMVNRNDRVVAATVVAGHVLYENGAFAEGFGTTVHAGKFLPADQSRVREDRLRILF